MARQFPKGFDEWVLRPPPEGEVTSSTFAAFLGNRDRPVIPEEDVPSAYFKHLKDQNRSYHRNITVEDHGALKAFDFPFESIFPKLPKNDECDDAVNFSVNINGASVSVRGMAIRVLAFNSSSSILKLENCYIGHVTVHNSNGNTRRMLLRNCWIGKLEMASNSIDSLIVEGGGIAHIKTPPPDRENPVAGSVAFENVLLPFSKKQTALYVGAQPYRNIRSHMEKLNNGPMAGLFRTLELRSERGESDRWLAKAFNYLYDGASGYGSSIGLPLFWALCLYAIGVGYALGFDSGVAPLDPDLYVGWRANLCNVDAGNIWRSFFLPLQSMISPAGILGARSLVAAQTAAGGAVFTTLGLIMDVMVFLSILAIRKRFKLP